MNTAQQVQQQAWVKFLKGPLSGTTFDIVQPTTTIGRDKNNDITVPDQKVSRFHARLLWDNGSWRVEKLSQTNTVTVAQQSIEGTALFHNVIVGLGEDSTFLFLLSLDDMQGEDVAQHPPFSESSPAGASAMMAAEFILADDQRSIVQHLEAAQTQPPRSVLQGQTAKPSGTKAASLTALGIPSVEITDNTGKTHHKYPLAQQVINIGRDTKNDVVISEQCVSDFHVQIVREGERYVLIHPHPERQETANGLLYQGRKIQGDEVFRKPLARGDVFRITDEYGLLVTLTYNDGHGLRQEVPPRVKPLQLGAAEITLGRLQDNDVVLNHPQVSAHHARLTREQESYRLTDLNSTNHTYVNGLRATSQLLQPRDEVRIGPFRFIYTAAELTQYDESESIRIDALDLKKVGNNQTILLNDISLSIPARSFVALVGGSGAGKTTLLDALSGLRPAEEGSVFYNGQDYYHHLAAFSTQLGYVPQEDIIHRDLTVERALYYAAKLRLPQDFTEAPIIGLLLLVLIKGVGPGGFDPGNVVQCPATAAIVAPGGYPDVPIPNNPIVSKSCPRVVNFLTNNPLGKAYANPRGGVNKALQDFIVSGPGEASSVLFLMTFAAIMFGCVNAIREIVKEAPIYKRERAVNVGILPYMFSKIVVLGVLCLVQSLILIVCVSIFDPFHHSIFLPPFLEIYITLTLTSLAGLMLGLMISALAPNSDRAGGLVPLLLLPQVIFSGAVFPLTNWFLQIIGVFFPARWAMIALSSSVGLHSEKVNGDELFGSNYSYHGTVFSIYSQSEALQYLLLMWLALIIMILVFGVAVGYFLKQKDSRG